MKTLLIIAFAALILSSCRKDMNEPVSPQQGQVEGASSKAINESLDRAALRIATSLKDPAVRSFIKTEALKQFDGDYDILYKTAKSIPINERSLENIFSDNTQAGFSRADGFERLIANVPNFQISVPVHCEEWDANNYTPLVAIAEFGIDEMELKQIKAYGSNGEIYFLDAKTNPDKPVIVVGVSERVDENGVLKHYFDGGSAAAARVNGQTSIAAIVNGQATILGSVMFPSGQLDVWTSGAPELILKVFGSRWINSETKPSAISLASEKYTPARNAINNAWFQINDELFNWYRYRNSVDFVLGSQAKFYWIEDDNDRSIVLHQKSVSINGSINNLAGTDVPVAVSTALFYGYDDDYLGFAVVNFGNTRSNYVYTTNVSNGYLQFELD